MKRSELAVFEPHMSLLQPQNKRNEVVGTLNGSKAGDAGDRLADVIVDQFVLVEVDSFNHLAPAFDAIVDLAYESAESFVGMFVIFVNLDIR